ncbi:hypothetical protein HTT03_10890 [Sulfitobacter sp. S0837]|nr:hypothetical protein [Sulfitobacter maritimus]
MQADLLGRGFFLTCAGVIQKIIQQAVQAANSLLQHAKIGLAFGAQAILLILNDPYAQFMHRP